MILRLSTSYSKVQRISFRLRHLVCKNPKVLGEKKIVKYQKSTKQKSDFHDFFWRKFLEVFKYENFHSFYY